jgi:hypothetical protein
MKFNIDHLNYLLYGINLHLHTIHFIVHILLKIYFSFMSFNIWRYTNEVYVDSYCSESLYLVVLQTCGHISKVYTCIVNNQASSIYLVSNLYNQTCHMWPSKGTVKYGHIRQVVTEYRFNWYEMHCEGK